MTHAGMLWYVEYNQRYWPTSPEERGLIALPLFHKNAMRGTVKPVLFAGGSFVLMPGYEPRAYLDALARYRCTYSRIGELVSYAKGPGKDKLSFGSSGPGSTGHLSGQILMESTGIRMEGEHGVCGA